jgi:FKBP-type peptidyl-prolyl cis-trans isomerase
MKQVWAVFAFVLLAANAAAAPARAQGAQPVSTATTGDPLSIEANQAYLAANAKRKGVIVRPSGLQFRIIQNGYGKRPGPTDSVTVYYTGTLINNVIFDGTSPGLPATFKLTGGLITGWVEALQLMREGDHWLLTIPPTLGYGSRGQGNGTIPPNQVLVFDLKLVSTKPAPKRGDKDYIPDPADKDDQQ